ncbi:SsrA-binding protein, partial [Candidatus Woesearchaeota archaeon]|nr:SsrA-binding protein [Candidatus Woesearchaeota archaeon]
AKGKQLHDKKDALKERDIQRDTERELHNFK